MKRKWNGNAIINRYVYDVVRRLPMSQRKEIEEELRAVIEDTLEPLDPMGHKDKVHVEKVLYELGKPSLLAATYRGEPRYLIGPAYFDEYVMLIKLIVPIVVTVLLGVGAFGIIASDNLMQGGIQIVASAISGGMQSLAWITGIMALVSYYDDKKESKEWCIDDLPDVEDDFNVIKRPDTIAGLVFLIIGMGLWTLFSDRIGIYIMSNTMEYIPMFNREVLHGVQYLVILILLLDIAQELYHLVVGRWTIRLLIADGIINTVSLILGLWFVNTTNLIHEPFHQMMQSWFAHANITFNLSWPAILTFFLIGIYMLEMLMLGYRLWSYHFTYKKS